MPTTHAPNFEHAIHSANIWVKSVCDSLETDDRHLAYRVLRVWLHLFRDRLTVDAAAHLAAQLPELLRGVYYEGWDPSIVPVKYSGQAYVDRFAAEAKVEPDEVPEMAAAVTEVARRHFSAGQLDAALEQLPGDIRALVGSPAR